MDKTMANEVEVGFFPDNCKSNRAAKSQNGNSHTTRSRFTQNSGPEPYTISINPLGDPTYYSPNCRDLRKFLVILENPQFQLDARPGQ